MLVSASTTVKWQYYPLVSTHPATRSFVESLVKRHLSAKTVDAYARNLEDLQRVFAAQTPPVEVVEATVADIETYLDHLWSRPRSSVPAARRARRARHDSVAQPDSGVGVGTGVDVGVGVSMGVADATIRQRLVTARLFYDFCLERELRAHANNPVPRGRRSSSAHGAQRGLVAFHERLPWIPSDATWAEMVAYVQQHDSLRNLVMLLLAYDGGLRRQELVGLCLRDVDWSVGMVTIRAEHAKLGRPRSVPFSVATEALLRQYVQTIRQTILAEWGGEVGGPLFLSESHRNPGQPLRIGAFNDILDRIRQQLHLPQFHPHTLRHLRCTVLKRCGVALSDIALFAGHRSVATTEKYLHLTPDVLCRRLRTATASFDARMQRLIQEADQPAR